MAHCAFCLIRDGGSFLGAQVARPRQYLTEAVSSSAGSTSSMGARAYDQVDVRVSDLLFSAFPAHAWRGRMACLLHIRCRIGFAADLEVGSKPGAEFAHGLRVVVGVNSVVI